MTTRRQFLQSTLIASLTAGCAARAPRVSVASAPSNPRPLPQPPVAASTKAPRYAVVIVLWGGYDPVLTFDPRDPGPVHDTIDCEYMADDRIQGKRRLYGPMIGDMIRHDDDMCIVHGCRVDTVAHAEGIQQVFTGHRLKNPDFLPPLAQSMPGTSKGSVLIAHSGLSHVTTDLPIDGVLGVDPYTARSLLDPVGPSYAAPPFFDEILAAQRAQASAVLRAYPQTLEGYQRLLGEAAAAHLWLDGAEHTSANIDPRLGPSLALVFGSIKQNRAKCSIVLAPEVSFDSHTDNLRTQRNRLLPAFHDIALLVDRLKAERNEHGSLFDQTTIAITTEMGRYPKMNATRGKDHWPENSWILMGGGIKKGVTIGGTDALLRGSSIDYRTGLMTGADLRTIHTDNFYATFVKACGGDVRACGYADSDVIGAALA